MQHLEVVYVLYSRYNRFQLKVGYFAQNKSSSTQLVENWHANWESRHLSSQSASVVVWRHTKRKSSMYDTSIFVLKQDPLQILGKIERL